jgi:hypothetical protein
MRLYRSDWNPAEHLHRPESRAELRHGRSDIQGMKTTADAIGEAVGNQGIDYLVRLVSRTTHRSVSLNVLVTNYDPCPGSSPSSSTDRPRRL